MPQFREELKRNLGYYEKGYISKEKYIDDVFIIARKYQNRRFNEEELLRVIKEEVYRQFKKSHVENAWLDLDGLIKAICEKSDELINHSIK